MYYIYAFILTFRTFTTPNLLFEKLIERFFVPSSFPNNISIIIQTRVVNFLKVCFNFYFIIYYYLLLLFIIYYLLLLSALFLNFYFDFFILFILLFYLL